MNPVLPRAGVPSLPASRLGEPTWEMASFYPRQGEWTEADYLALNTNRMVELSDGCLETCGPEGTGFDGDGTLVVDATLGPRHWRRQSLERFSPWWAETEGGMRYEA